MGTQEVELERAGEKSAVDGSDPVCSFIWRHGSASILGTTRTVTRAPMLMFGRLVPNSLTTGEKVEIRPWIGLTNGV